MSSTAKTGIILVVILAIIVIFWIWRGDSMKVNETPMVTDQSEMTQKTPVEPVSNLVGTGLSAPAAISDDSLNSDLSAVDAQIKSLGDDTAGIDQGITDINK